MRRIALFGGSFDPPHVGHVLCASYAWSVAELDAIWVLPVDVHPYGKALEAWEHRWAMCLAAFAGFGFVEVRDDERRNPQGRTFDLVTTLRQTHPDVRFSLIGGTDTRHDMGNWYRGAELLELVDVVAVPRRGFDDGHPAALPAISSTAIRELRTAGDRSDGLLPAAVATYLEAHGLYR